MKALAREEVERRRARSRRARWARAFRPEKVGTLLIAEAPPSALDRYFYFPNVSTHNSLFREVAHAITSMQPTRENKRELLTMLQVRGVFMIDAVPEPVDGRYSIDVGRLISRVRRLLPERVIVVKAGVFDRVFEPLRDAGIPIVPIRIPFPGSGQQVTFRREFARARSLRLRGGLQGA